MLSLKDIKSFEVNNSFKITGGEMTNHSSGQSDAIYEEDGINKMDINGDPTCCQCGSGTTYSFSCCPNEN